MLGSKCCHVCRWYDTEYAACLNNESIYRARFRNADDVCDWFDEFNARAIDWKREAQTQAAAAGELRILLACRLDELRTQQTALRRHLALEDSDLDRVIVTWKIEQLQEQIEWLEEVLYERN